MKRMVCLLGVCWIVGTASAAPPVQEAALPPFEWQPRMQAALAAYQRGEYMAAQALARRVQEEAPGGELRRQAQMIHAMCLLRMPDRRDKVTGRTLLAQLAEDDPRLDRVPECNLAFGAAQAALHETVDAIRAVELAVQGFQRTERLQRAAEALVMLAEAWAAHNEWEFMPAGWGVPRPRDAEHAHEIRVQQLESIRTRVGELPGADEAQQRVKLVLADYLLTRKASEEAGWTMLEELAKAPGRGPAIAEAAVRVAELYETQRRWNEAIDLYERARRHGPAEWADRAEKRLQQLRRPQLELVAPETVRPEETARFGLRTRGMARAVFEVRAVDLPQWLQEAPLRGVDTNLPEAGSLHYAREFDTRTADIFAWWTAPAGAPLDYALPAGAYVVIARATDFDGQAHVEKRLLLSTALWAAAAVGPNDVAVWATRRAAGGQAPVDGQVRFWMQRSFQPVRTELQDGTVLFRLPNEARIMRERGWVCLVQSGAELALCRGTLGEADAPARVFLTAGPSPLRVGEELHVSGMLIRAAVPAAATELTLELLDPVSKVLGSFPVAVSPAGTFSRSITISPAWAGEHARLVVRLGKQTLPNVAGRVAIAVEETDLHKLDLQLDAPPRLAADAKHLRGNITARYPWGTLAAGAWTSVVLGRAALPVRDFDPGQPFPTQAILEGRVRSTALGRAELPLQERAAPASWRWKCRVSTWFDWRGSLRDFTLQADGPQEAWLLSDAPAPSVGKPWRIGVAWAAPEPLPLVGWGTAQLEGGGLPTSVPLVAGPRGLHAVPLVPRETGEVRVQVTLPLVDRPPIEVEQRFHVQPDPDAAAPLRVLAERQPDHIRVRITGTSAGPLLTLLEADDPLAAAEVPQVNGPPREMQLRASDGVPLDARVLVFERLGNDLHLRGAADVRPPTALSALSQGLAGDLWPGGVARVESTASAPAGTRVLARLVPLSAGGRVGLAADWRQDAAGRRVTDLTFALSAGGAVENLHDSASAGVSPVRGVPESLWGAWMEGATLWCAAQTLSAETAVAWAAPLPARVGQYRLLTSAQLPDGTVRRGATLIDGRRGAVVNVHLPPRLQAGDRTFAAVVVENGADTELHGELQLAPGAGLAVESINVGAEMIKTAATAAGGVTFDLVVPARQKRYCQVWVEAATPGEHTFELRGHYGAQAVAARTTYAVADAPADVADADAIRVQRELTVWTGEGLAVELEAGQPVPALPLEPAYQGNDKRTFTREPWEPGQRLRPGQYLHIRETVLIPARLPGGQWQQSAAANCFASIGTNQDFAQIGSPTRQHGWTIGYRLTPQEPGEYVHEYLVEAIRPGVCTLPPPVVAVEGRRWPVLVDEPVVIGVDAPLGAAVP